VAEVLRLHALLTRVNVIILIMDSIVDLCSIYITILVFSCHVYMESQSQSRHTTHEHWCIMVYFVICKYGEF